MNRPVQAGVAGVLILVLGGCDVGTTAPQRTDGPMQEPTMTAHSTPQPGDRQVLFDGVRTDALRGYGMDEFPADRWVVDLGELRTVPGSGIDLITRDTFGDFELEFEWRVAPGGNSGVMYRVVETAEPAWTTGPEYQALDDALHPDGRDAATSAAALYDLIAPATNKRLEPVGSFNRGRIVVREGRVEHWLNGERVVSYDWDGTAVRELVAASKFAGLEGFMAAESGHVVFQHHGEEAAFRDIRIRSLGP